MILADTTDEMVEITSTSTLACLALAALTTPQIQNCSPISRRSPMPNKVQPLPKCSDVIPAPPTRPVDYHVIKRLRKY